MLVIKQVFAKSNLGNKIIDDPLKDFIKTLPKNGEEIVDIKYATYYRGNVFSAIVQYKD